MQHSLSEGSVSAFAIIRLTAVDAEWLSQIEIYGSIWDLGCHNHVPLITITNILIDHVLYLKVHQKCNPM